jgi:hypothetical protein
MGNLVVGDNQSLGCGGLVVKRNNCGFIAQGED